MSAKNGKWDGIERRHGSLSDRQFEAIAKRACNLVQERFYEAVGRQVIKWLLYLAGVLVCSFYLFYRFLVSQGLI